MISLTLVLPSKHTSEQQSGDSYLLIQCHSVQIFFSDSPIEKINYEKTSSMRKIMSASFFCRPPYGEDNDRGFSQLVEYTGGSRHLFSLPGLYFVLCILYFVFGRVNRRVKTSISSARFVFNPFRKENMKKRRF